MAKKPKTLAEVAEAIRKNHVKLDVLAEKVAPLREEEEALREEMIARLEQEGLDSAKHKGQVYSRVLDITYAVANIEKAQEWAKNNGLLRIDKMAANKALRRLITTPDGFERVQGYHLSITKEK